MLNQAVNLIYQNQQSDEVLKEKEKKDKWALDSRWAHLPSLED